jgi:hypothetical protein
LIPPVVLLLFAVGVSLLWLFVLLILSIFLHELGHAIAAWAGGYQVTSFGIGSGKPILLLRLPRSGTIFYICRLGYRFSGVTWVYYPKGVPPKISDLFLACGGALTNAVIACIAALLLASFEQKAVSFLLVWVPTVVLLLVNSVLALLFFVPHQTMSTEQGTLTSDGLQVLTILFPNRFRGRQSGSIVTSLRTLSQKRDFWESIGDTTMICIALIRVTETYLMLGDKEAVRNSLAEFSSLSIMPKAELFRCAWESLLTAVSEDTADTVTRLKDAEKSFEAIENKAGVLRVARERLLRTDKPVTDSALLELQREASLQRDAAFALILLVDRIELLGKELLQETPVDTNALERLASQYDAARLDVDSSTTDVRVYGIIASVRVAVKDDGGAVIAYERALSAARRLFIALAFLPEVQKRFAARQAPLIGAAVDCCRRLGRDTDAVRYARLLA